MRPVVSAAPRRAIPVSCLLALAALVGCTKNLNVDAVAPAITQGVSDQVGLTLASVTCPSDPRPLAANDTFDCRGAVDGGGSLTIAVTQTDDTGNITWKVASTDGLLDLAKVEALDRHRPEDPGACRRKRLVRRQVEGRRQGRPFDCQATAPDGTPIPIGVTVADGDGNVSWETK